MRVLCLNAGSSSLKAALFAVDDAGNAHPEVTASAERIGVEGGQVTVSDGRRKSDHARALDGHAEALTALLEGLRKLGASEPDAIGHRLVHGGDAHARPVRVTAELRAALGELVRLAPLHLPANLAVLDAVTDTYPSLPQVACFDTAFHRTMPERHQRLALPEHLWDVGIRRYGFHGLSCESAIDVLEPGEGERMIIAHLGNGASLTAVRGRRSLWNTMGFTPTGGIVMGTRSGDLDPGVLVHLLRKGTDVDTLDALVNQQSGLHALSGGVRDMRTLLERRASDERAALAVAVFCDHARMAIGALTTVLGGLDTLVFTGGIGERAAAVRAEICADLGYLGITLGEAANRGHAALISSPASSVTVRVLEADENRVIARHVAALLR